MTSSPSSSFSALIIFSLIFFSNFCSPCFSSQSPPASAKIVAVSLYYESLSLACAGFIVHNLSKLDEIVNLNLVQYGNTILLKNDTIICRKVSVLNTLEACVFNFLPL
ncbi:hypothetical protein MKW92_000410 [Papaver armeniacum]|nr:hypothetical protein MKW92_000410 [Papaver armeniacum]